MSRRTKIVCTLGPATAEIETIRSMIDAGMDVVRLNFSHGTHADHKQLITRVRQASREMGRRIPILQDLQGPKIRIGPMYQGAVLLHEGQQLSLTTRPIKYGTEERVFISYPTLTSDVHPGGRILMDDGQIELEVIRCEDEEVITEVIVGGPLRSRKGVNLPHMKSDRPALTQKDIRDLEFGLSMDVDLLALSFVRSRQDVVDLMDRVRHSGKDVTVIAKIEKPEAVAALDRILEEADAIMVARGDLGIEMSLSEIPITQKMIINKCLHAARPVITATQMLVSMVKEVRPTRAEVSDVYSAVRDGTDAVMLSESFITTKNYCL